MDNNKTTPTQHKRCTAEVEVYSRVVGFFRPIKQWNDGKREEYKDRTEYKLDKTGQHKGGEHTPTTYRTL